MKIFSSLLAADAACLGEEAQKAIRAGADGLHLDVMDNHYVPNLTFGPLVCSALRKHGIQETISVHLMATPVDALIDDFSKAGASLISFHPEASLHVHRSLMKIKENGCKAGLAFNPITSLDILEYALPLLDEVLIMTVNPGFGGQHFIEECLDKITQVRRILDEKNAAAALAVDGGITLENIQAVKNAGADTFVVGTALFSTHDYQATLDAFRA